jgi:glucose-1-phosphate thymidylyltransferase
MSGPAKALILTDGPPETNRWRRLGVRARPLVPIANRPVVLHALEALGAAGVDEATVLADGAMRAELGEVLGEGTADLAIRYADHIDDRALDAGAVVVQPADALLRAPLDGLLGEVGADDLDSAVLRLATSAATADPRDLVAGAEVAACVVGPRAADALMDCFDGPQGTVEGLADCLVRVASPSRVRVGDVRGCRACGDGDDRLLHANRILLEGLTGVDAEGATLIGSEIQGAAVVHPTATLESTLVRGPVVIGPGAHLSDAYIGPYTSIGEDVRIEGAEVEHSLLLAGVQIRHPGARLTSSIIGPRARLMRDFHLPRGIRLTFAPDAVIAMS